MPRRVAHAAVVVATAAALALGGCATAEKHTLALNEGESFASHILRGADIRGIDDAPSVAASEAAALRGGLAQPGDITSVGNVVFSAMAGGLDAGFGAALFSFTRPRSEEAQTSAIVAWAPVGFASSPEEARVKFFRLVEEAFLQAERQIETEAHVDRESGTTQSLTMTYPFDYIRFVWMERSCQMMAQHRCSLVVASNGLSKPRIARSPAVLGGYPAWTFDRTGGLIRVLPVAEDDAFLQRYHAAMDDLSLYIEASRRLPDWAFIYVAPLRAGYRAEDSYRLYGTPIVLNQGRAHYFVEGATRRSVQLAAN